MKVMSAMIARPVPNRSLVGAAVGKHDDAAEEWAGGVGTVRPQPVRAARDAEASNWPQHEGKPERCRLAARDVEEAGKAEEVDESDVRAHRPADVLERPASTRRAGPSEQHTSLVERLFSMYHGGSRSCFEYGTRRVIGSSASLLTSPSSVGERESADPYAANTIASRARERGRSSRCGHVRCKTKVQSFDRSWNESDISSK